MPPINDHLKTSGPYSLRGVEVGQSWLKSEAGNVDDNGGEQTPDMVPAKVSTQLESEYLTSATASLQYICNPFRYPLRRENSDYGTDSIEDA